MLCRLFLVLVLAASLAQPAAAGITTGQHHKTLFVSQKYAGGVNDIKAFATLPATSGDSQAQDIGGEPVPNASSALGTLPIKNYDPALTTAQLQEQADATMGVAVPVVSASLANYLKQKDIEQAWFDFVQEVPNNGKIKYLLLSFVVKQSGERSYPGVTILDSMPTILYVRYVPKAVAAGLPAGWAYPDAGTIQWQLRDKQFQPLTAWTAIDVAGAYDEPQPSGGAKADPDAGLKCLVNKASSPACPQGYPDVKSLMAAQDAQSAVVDYARILKPVYDKQADGTEVARVSMSVDERRADYHACGPITYSNKGRYGYTLQNTTDRYLVKFDGAYSPVNQFKTTSISPTQDYAVSASVPYAQNASLANSIVSPTGSGALVAASSIKNMIYLAPVTISGNTDASMCCDKTRAGQWFATGYAYRNGSDRMIAEVLCEPDRKDGYQTFRVYAHGGAGACIGWQPFAVKVNAATPSDQPGPSLSPHWEGSCVGLNTAYSGPGCTSTADGSSCAMNIGFGWWITGPSWWWTPASAWSCPSGGSLGVSDGYGYCYLGDWSYPATFIPYFSSSWTIKLNYTIIH